MFVCMCLLLNNLPPPWDLLTGHYYKSSIVVGRYNTCVNVSPILPPSEHLHGFHTWRIVANSFVHKILVTISPIPYRHVNNCRKNGCKCTTAVSIYFDLTLTTWNKDFFYISFHSADIVWVKNERIGGHSFYPNLTYTVVSLNTSLELLMTACQRYVVLLSLK